MWTGCWEKGTGIAALDKNAVRDGSARPGSAPGPAAAASQGRSVGIAYFR